MKQVPNLISCATHSDINHSSIAQHIIWG